MFSLINLILSVVILIKLSRIEYYNIGNLKSEIKDLRQQTGKRWKEKKK